jgi:integrase
MAKKVKITRKDKVLNKEQVFLLLDEFIRASSSGKRLKKNGARISHGTVTNYQYLQKHLIGFAEAATFELKIYIAGNLTQSQKERAKSYYRKFYRSFTNYLYKQGHFDNYVGLIIKNLRIFFNYLLLEKMIDVGHYHRSFFVPVEEIPIVTISKEHLQYMLNNETYNEALEKNDLVFIRDIFVFGCTVALRISDLLALSRKNLVIKNENYYIQVKSKKTGTNTTIKLPPYAVDILLKYYRKKNKTIFPTISVGYINKQLKRIGKFLPDDFEMIKTRERKGKQVVVYKDPEKKQHYMLSDHITAHTMRRTAITNMLSLGMPEHLVRKISGHAPNSKEFYRYVELSQSFLDKETDLIFDKLMS